MQTISFSVSYGLREYLSFIREHVPVVQAARGKTMGAISKGIALFFIYGFAPLVFLYKVHRMPVCDFVIDEKEIRRTTRGGTLVVKWSDLIAVRRYSRGFLLDKGAKGAMPLPYRCFSPEQRVAIEGFIQAFEAPVKPS